MYRGTTPTFTFKSLRQVETGIVYGEAVDIEGAPYTYEEAEDEEA